MKQGSLRKDLGHHTLPGEAAGQIYYRECTEVFENIPEHARLPVDTEGEDWLSLFALGINGYTQRHRDVRDIHGGLAGLLSLGSYKGMCVLTPVSGLIPTVKKWPGY
jgi:hypothetical protein